MNPKDYVIQFTTGNLFAVREDDPIRDRKDMRTPTQAEVDAWFESKLQTEETDSKPAEAPRKPGRPKGARLDPDMGRVALEADTDSEI